MLWAPSENHKGIHAYRDDSPRLREGISVNNVQGYYESVLPGYTHTAILSVDMIEPRIALIASRYRDGGVERWMTRLAGGLEELGYPCDLLIGEQPVAGMRPNALHVWLPRASENFRQLLERYLETHAPAVTLLPFRTVDYSAVLDSARTYEICHRVFLVTGAFIGDRLHRRKYGFFRAWKTGRRLRREWSRAGGVIAVSPEVRADWLATGTFSADQIHAPPPPIVGTDVREASLSATPHPWLEAGEPPVVLGVGRLHGNKAFHRLLNGFARLRQRRHARLIILGKGEERVRLEQQAARLGIADDVLMPGFVDNPFSWMRLADMLVVPSRIEPFGFVLIEAMYLGTPFIADESPPGPRSIREVTGYGSLVRSASAEALASEMERLIVAPPSADELCRAASAYDASNSVPRYLEVIEGQ